MSDLNLEIFGSDATDATKLVLRHIHLHGRVCGSQIGWKSLRDTTRVWHNARAHGSKQESKLKVSFYFSTKSG